MRFLLWAAVSSKPQLEGDSLDKQLSDARALVDSLDDAHITGELTVPGHSRSIVLFEDAAREMPAYADLKAACDRKAFDVLVCRSLDRLGRTSALVTTVAALVEAAGATVYELDNPTPLHRNGQSDDRLYIQAFRSANAEAEVRRFQRHREFGMRARIRRGQAPNNPPYGYRKVGHARDSRMEIVPEEAEVVRQIFGLYLRGLGFNRICNHLNDNGVPAQRGGPWARSSVKVILDNPFYAGYVTWGRRRGAEERFIAEGQHEPILDAETWRKVEQERERRRLLHSRGQASDRPFTGVVFCQKCGAAMTSVGSSRPRANGRGLHQRRGYSCGTYQAARKLSHMENRCHSNYVVDKKIRAAIEGIQADIRQTGADVVALERQRERNAPSPDQVSAVEKQLTTLDAERKRLVVAYTRGQSLTVEEFEDGIGGTEKRRQSLERQLADLKHEAATDSLADVTARLQALAACNLDGDPQQVRATLAKALRIWCEERQIVRMEIL